MKNNETILEVKEKLNNDFITQEIKQLLENIEKSKIIYNQACKELVDLASADFPGPVIKERYTFISFRAKRTLDEIIELKIKLKNL